MLTITLLGTAATMPLPDRALSAAFAACGGHGLLWDCGEGTQIAIKEKGWSFKPIDILCITHYHADHISGLPGLLLAMAFFFCFVVVSATLVMILLGNGG